MQPRQWQSASSNHPLTHDSCFNFAARTREKAADAQHSLITKIEQTRATPMNGSGNELRRGACEGLAMRRQLVRCVTVSPAVLPHTKVMTHFCGRPFCGHDVDRDFERSRIPFLSRRVASGPVDIVYSIWYGVVVPFRTRGNVHMVVGQ